MKVIITLIAFAVLVAVVSIAVRDNSVSLRVRDHHIRVEVADTPEAQHRGLMGRTALCDNCGMLFVYPVADRYAFWMKNTPLPLSVAFIGADSHIINIAEMKPLSSEMHFAAGDALYVLEMSKGWFRDHGVKPGDKILGICNGRVGACPALE
jgi:hypothetical protein